MTGREKLIHFETQATGSRLPKFLSGENPIKQTLEIANQTILDIYPLLKKDYAEQIGEFLSTISSNKILQEKLSSLNQRARVNFTLDQGCRTIQKMLELIPDLVDLGKNGDRSIWKELMRNGLSSRDSEIIDSPNVRIVACGAELFAILPEKSFNDSPSIGTRFNKGIVQIFMEPFLSLFSLKMTKSLTYLKARQTDEKFEARRILKNLDNESLATDREQLLEAYTSSLIPAYILSSSKIPLLNYPK